MLTKRQAAHEVAKRYNLNAIEAMEQVNSDANDRFGRDYGKLPYNTIAELHKYYDELESM